jgi:hypothetical protein
MTTSFDLTPEQVKLYTDQAEAEFVQHYMTAKEVEEKFKVSMSRQTQLIRAGKLIVVKSAQRVLYPRDFALWWFGQYVASQQARISTKLAKNEKKAGRPKKSKGEFTYTLFGTEYTSNEPLEVVWDKWKDYIASQYPQYYKGGKAKGCIVELLPYQPVELSRAMSHIEDTFRKLKYSDKKSASGKSK